MKAKFAGVTAGCFFAWLAMAAGGPLVSTQWLAEHLDDPAVRVVAVDDIGAPAYATGHIPGAIGIVLQSDLMTPVRRNFLGVRPLEQLAGRLGLHAGRTIVFYDAGGLPEGGLPAVYAYWVFRYRGAAKIAVLDGGLAKWQAEGREITTAAPAYRAARYSLAGTVPGVRMFGNDILRRLASRRVTLIDVRTSAEFHGKAGAPPGKPQNAVTVYGHIPTARNIHWETNLTGAGTFKSAHRLERAYRRYLRPVGPPIASYCLRGERGVVTWFVLHELLGQKRARLYDGSWTEWGNRVDVPVDR